jgi:cell division protein FtsL
MPDVAVKWLTGICSGILLIMITVIFSLASAVSNTAADVKILESKVNSMDSMIKDMRNSAESVSKTASDMRVDQATFQTALKYTIEGLSSDLTILKKAHTR